jgi:uncharacterized protein YjiS (DUF1127 family)
MGNLLVNLLARYRAHIVYREAVRELNRLSDHELRDIGISRCEIDCVAKQACKDSYLTD